MSGWGRNLMHRGLQSILQYAEFDIIDRRNCSEIWRRFNAPKLVTENNICAGDESRVRKDACQGDSGGPLTCKDPITGEGLLCGIVSFGADCDYRRKSFIPGLYTDVRKYHGWIRKYMQIWGRYYWSKLKAKRDE